MSKITKNGNGWLVPSKSNGDAYNVEFSEFEHKHSCTCPDYQYRKIECKHIFAVELIVTEEINEKGTFTQTVTKKVSYTQIGKHTTSLRYSKKNCSCNCFKTCAAVCHSQNTHLGDRSYLCLIWCSYLRLRCSAPSH